MSRNLRYPTRHDRPSYHAQYGILNWLEKVGITDHQQQDKLIDDFLATKDFKLNGKDKDATKVKASFISNRFGEFSKFVLNNKPEEQEQTW